MTTYGAVGLGLASPSCSACGCECTSSCDCTPTAISFYMQAPDCESVEYSCDSCGAYSSPFEVVLSADICDASLKENIEAATHWLYRDTENFCEEGCGDFGGTDYTTCFGEGDSVSCGESIGTNCDTFAPSCVKACFSGGFSIGCRTCDWIGLDVPLPDFSISYEYEFRALMGNLVAVPDDYAGSVDPCDNPDSGSCVIWVVYFIKIYMAPNNTCTDMVLAKIIRKEFFVSLNDSCCGESTCDINPVNNIRTTTCSGYTGDISSLDSIISANFNCYPCLAGDVVVAEPGHPEQTKVTVTC